MTSVAASANSKRPFLSKSNSLSSSSKKKFSAICNDATDLVALRNSTSINHTDITPISTATTSSVSTSPTTSPSYSSVSSASTSTSASVSISPLRRLPSSPSISLKKFASGLRSSSGSCKEKVEATVGMSVVELSERAQELLKIITGNPGGEIQDEENGKVSLASSSLEDALRFFFFMPQDDKVINSFVFGYGHFVTTTRLLSALNAVLPAAVRSENGNANTSFFTFFRKWLIVWYFRIVISDTQLAVSIVETVKSISEILPKEGEELYGLAELLKAGNRVDTKDKTKAPDTILPKKNLSTTEEWKLTHFDDLEVARQLCLIERDNFGKLSPEDLYHSCWSKSNSESGIHEIAFFSNNLTRWIVYQILQEKSVDARSRILIHIIKIAGHLLALHNFNSLLAFYLALENHVTQRLTSVWKLVPKKVLSIYNTIAVMDPSRNFTKYRALVATLLPPLIPCHEIILKDLLYSTEVGDDFTDEEKMVNVRKLLGMGDLISKLLNYESMQYNFFFEYSIYSSLREGVIDCPYTEEQLEALI